MSQQIEIMVSPVQLSVLQQALIFEIKTGMVFAGQPALKIFKRLIGVEVAKGQKGREQALEIVESLLAQLDVEEDTDADAESLSKYANCMPSV
jgi:hypothetical protein